MGLLNNIFGSTKSTHRASSGSRKHARRGIVRGQVEVLEPRQMLSSDGVVPDILLGSVYFEEATGDDSQPDVIEVTFVGGAEGTTLNSLVISGDKRLDGLTDGDIFFDTEDGGAGAFKAVGLSIVDATGITVESVSVVDGGTDIVITFSGFEAGESLKFSVDADELQFADPEGDSVNSLVEGAEFERSTIKATFSAEGYLDRTLEAKYWDAFDTNVANAEAAVGLALDMPDDAYSDVHDYTDRTAGAVAYAAQIPLATISGWVYHDRSNDGVFDTATEEGIGGVTLELLDADGNGLGIYTTTSSAEGSVGYYEFRNLDAGTYGVREVQPDGWLDGIDTAGSHGGTAADETSGIVDEITGAVLDYGDDGINYNFGELQTGSISGRVTVSYDETCHFDDPQGLLEGVQIDLLDADGNVLATTYTDSEGRYTFDELAPGEYQIREHQPTEYYDGGERIGSEGGTKSDIDDTYSLFSEVVLGSGVDAIEYDFCEHVGASLSGWVYHDESNDGIFDSIEDGIGGVVVELLDVNGVPTGITTMTSSETGKVGYYEFTNLAPGTYGVREIQPAGWLDGIDTAGTHGGTAADESLGIADLITGATLYFGDAAMDYNFGELLPGSISGRVSASTDGTCHFDDPEILLEGVQIDLLDANGNLLATTYTAADGTYSFTGLAPGTYQVYEHQPDEYLNGGRRVGSEGGTKTGTDAISEIVLGSGVDGIQYDFCEHLGATLSGYVYHDRSNDGIYDTDTEEPIAGVTLKLLDADGNDTGLRAVTDENGYYEFTDLDTGTYAVVEMHPDGWIDGIDTPGSLSGTSYATPSDVIELISITAGQQGTEYNFGELLPGSISGHVWVDPDGDCIHEEGDPPIEGVQIDLLDEDGNVLATTYTDADGYYIFDDLNPGNYTVYEHQPEGYFNGGYEIGSGGGSYFGVDRMGDIELGSDQDLIDYDFCEIPPATISGFVFIDGEPILVVGELTAEQLAAYDGQLTSDDTLLAGVVLELRNGYSGDPIFGDEALDGYYESGVPIRTVTDANGYYMFSGLPAGVYAVVEVQPDGLIDYLDTEGTLGGLTVNVQGAATTPQLEKTAEQQTAIEQMKTMFGTDVIFRIAITPGQHAEMNNFSELTTTTFWLPPEDPPVDEPPVFPPTLSVPDQPLLPQALPQKVVPPTYGGGSQVYGFTWHLSLVNAGYPRSNEAAEQVLMELTSTHFTAASWQQAQLDQATWTLGEKSELSADDEEGIEFGNLHGIPVVGDWDGDGDDDIGVYIDGRWYLDLNDNGRWDSGDIMAMLGNSADLPTTGDWDGDGKTDIAIYGPVWAGDPWAIENEPGLPDAANQPGPLAPKAKNVPPKLDEATLGERLLRRSREGDMRGDLIDHVFHYGVGGDQPVTGDWNGDGIATIGVFRGGVWNLDTDGDGRFTAVDQAVVFGGDGTPIVGDWNGDGIDDLGVFADGHWTLDSNGNREQDARDRVFEMGSAKDKPVAGDWNGDGVDEPGLYTPHATTTPAVDEAA